MIALFSPFQSNERSRNGMERSRSLLLEKPLRPFLYTCCHASRSLMLIVFVLMSDVFINVYVFVYTQTLVDADDML